MQTSLLCPCGSSDLQTNGLCPRCERRLRLSREHFGGLRDRALARDTQCLVCGEISDLLVHHRRPINQLRWLCTLCRRDHARVHHRYQPAADWTEYLRELWREQHLDLAEQLTLALYAINETREGIAYQKTLWDAA